ncbi:MAG TPA: DUF488 family protein [Terriglobales bacterium]|nr:DUF488 family protein [Terriglobales bacterium]
MPVALKRAYEKPAPADGVRVLVDRLWPRGLNKSDVRINEWLKDLAPSNELRRWYHANPDQFAAFRKKYLDELSAPEATQALERLYALLRSGKTLTLVFASRNSEQNNATVLKQLLEGMRKPPSNTGPVKAGAGRSRARMQSR